MFCSPPGRASAQLGPGRVKILRLAFQVTTVSQQKKHPLFVFTSAPPATGQLLSRLITQPLAWLDVLCAMNQGLTSCDLWSASLSSAMYCRSVLGKLGGTLCLDSAASPSRKDLYSSPIPPRANLQTAR